MARACGRFDLIWALGYYFPVMPTVPLRIMIKQNKMQTYFNAKNGFSHGNCLGSRLLVTMNILREYIFYYLEAGT